MRGPGQAQRRLRLRDAGALGQQAPGQAGHDRRSRRGRARAQEAPAFWPVGGHARGPVRRRRPRSRRDGRAWLRAARHGGRPGIGLGLAVLEGRRRLGHRARGGADEQPQRAGRGGAADQRRERPADVGGRPGQRGRDADRGEHRQADHAVGEPAHGKHAHDRGEDRQRRQDAGDQDHLVVRAESGDREALHRGRGEADRGFADGNHRRGVRRHEPGNELADAERDGGGKQPRDHAPAHSRDVHLESHTIYSRHSRGRIGPLGGRVAYGCTKRRAPGRRSVHSSRWSGRDRAASKPGSGWLRI